MLGDSALYKQLWSMIMKLTQKANAGSLRAIVAK